MALRPELGSGSRAEGARAVQASWHPDVRPSARTRQLGSAIAVFLCSAAGPFLRPGQSIMRRAARSVGQGWPRGHRRRRRGGVPLRPARWGPAAALTDVSTTRRSPSRGTMSSAATHWVMVLSAVRDAAARWHRGKAGAPMSRTRSRRGVPQGRTRGRRASSRWGQAAARRAYAGRISCGPAPTVMLRPTRPTCPSGTRRRRARCCASPPRACARRPPSPAAGRCAPPASGPSP